MTKKILFVLLAATLSLCGVAQNAVGDWLIHTSYVGEDVTGIVEGNQWVYYLAGGNLFRLDKSTAENESLNKVNDLSDMSVSQIYYNSDKDYVMVVYANANIDIILSNGSVVNMPELKDAVMTSSKTINDVTFAPGLIYLATAFGYMVIDDNKFVVKESHLYGTPVVSVAQVGGLVLLTTADAFYYDDASVFHEHLSSFKKGDVRTDCRLWPVSNNSFYCVTGSTNLVTISHDNEGNVTFDLEKVIYNAATVIQRTTGGFLLNVPSLEKCYRTGNDGRNPEAIDTGGELCSSNPDGDGTLWAVGPQGLHQLGSENYFMPNALSFSTPFWMAYNESQDQLYVSSPTANAHIKTAIPTSVNTYDGMVWKDVTPEGAPQDGSYWMEFMPGDPETYLMGTWNEGLLKVVNNEIAMVYDSSNSPMLKKTAMHPITTIDRNGNVWVVQSYENPDHPVMVLPAAKARLNTVTAADWLTPVIDGAYTKHTQRASFISTHYGSHDIKVFTDGDFQMPLFIWDSEDGIPSRPKQTSFSALIDQDGESISWTYIMCLAEDRSGYVWMGTTEGLCMFNPIQAFNGGAFNVIRPKVPRNDGTNLADRLMDGIQVNCVAVDGINRKWIGTQTSGLFLVSANGEQILKKFNTTNSPLASNTIYQVCCNPNSNSVYVTTPAGLYEYFSDSSPAESTYDNILAYPNPVRPEYSGDVTFTGMMDNSLIKISDASGNVIRQLKSTGGMAIWDCCDEYGEKVKTGVYMVFASQANGSGKGAVTKVAVIR